MKTDTRLFSWEAKRLNDEQRKNFMEKKIKRTDKNNNSGSVISEEKVIIATILVAIVVMSGVLVWAMIENPATTEQFTAMYVLDSEKQANNYPTTVVLGTNSTFSLWVGVENQEDKTMEYSLQLKQDDGTSTKDPNPAEPIQTFDITLADGEKWEFQVTIDINQAGTNRVIFELYFFNTLNDKWDYVGNSFGITVEATQP